MGFSKSSSTLLNLALLFLVLISLLQSVISAPNIDDPDIDLKTTTKAPKTKTTTEVFTETILAIEDGTFYPWTTTYTATLTLPQKRSVDPESGPEATTFVTNTREAKNDTTASLSITLAHSSPIIAAEPVDIGASPSMLSESNSDLSASGLEMRNDEQIANSSSQPTYYAWLLRCGQETNTTYIADCWDRGLGGNIDSQDDNTNSPLSTRDELGLEWDLPDQLTGVKCYSTCYCDCQGYMRCPKCGKCADTYVQGSCATKAACHCVWTWNALGDKRDIGVSQTTMDNGGAELCGKEVSTMASA